MSYVNAYRILGISRLSGKDKIKAAYRVLAKQLHPDLGGNNQQMLAINQAYNTLKQKHGL